MGRQPSFPRKLKPRCNNRAKHKWKYLDPAEDLKDDDVNWYKSRKACRTHRYQVDQMRKLSHARKNEGEELPFCKHHRNDRLEESKDKKEDGTWFSYCDRCRAGIRARYKKERERKEAARLAAVEQAGGGEKGKKK